MASALIVAMFFGAGSHEFASPVGFVAGDVSIEPLVTTGQQIEQALGPGVVVRDAMDESAPILRCYVSGREQRPQYLIVESGAAGGFGRLVTAFEFSAAAPDTGALVTERARPATEGRRGPCARTEARLARAGLRNGVRLGDTREQVRRRMAKPTRRDGDVWLYLRDQVTNTPLGADYASSPARDYEEVRIEFRAGRVVRLRVERSNLL